MKKSNFSDKIFEAKGSVQYKYASVIKEHILEKIYYNGKIYSIDEQNTAYTAIGIEKGKIAFLGSDEEALRQDAAEKIDLDGKTMVPGFVDSHLHLLNYAFVAQSYKMNDAESVEEIVQQGRAISEQMDAKGDTGWLYGRGWNELNFTDEKRVLTKHDLDMISTERPILFIRVCGHAAAVNSKALEIVMNLEQTKDYIDQIDEENGILTEASVKLCYNGMKEPSVEQIKEMILFAQKHLNKAGITGVESDDFLSLPGRNSQRIIKAYQELEAEGKLTLRVREQASFTDFDHMKAFIDSGYRTGDGGDYYTIGPIKLYEDGSLGARTALMNEPYLGTDTFGTAVHDQEETDKLVDYAYKNGMQILIHAIGDKASDMVCNSYEKAIEKYGERDSRLGINHLQVVSEDLYDRMKKHNMVAYLQPVFVAGDKAIIAKLMGEKVAARSYMWKTAMEKGLICGGGSDAPVEDFDILKNMQIGVTRDCIGEKSEGWHPEEKLTISDVVRMFTINNAYVAFQENVRGSLEIGKDADMTVLTDDIFETEPHKISEIKIDRTIVGGKEVYNA